MSTQEIKRVGVIGLGKMGLPIARRLAERGFAVIGYDVALAALKAAAAAGVQPVLRRRSLPVLSRRQHARSQVGRCRGSRRG